MSQTDEFNQISHFSCFNSIFDAIEIVNSHFNCLILFVYLQFDNVDSCLNLLRRHQIEGLESISAYDICAGRKYFKLFN